MVLNFIFKLILGTFINFIPRQPGQTFFMGRQLVFTARNPLPDPTSAAGDTSAGLRLDFYKCEPNIFCGVGYAGMNLHLLPKLSYSFPGFDTIGSTATLRLNTHGKRYSNEGFGNHVLASIPGARQPNGMLWSIFDSNVLEETTYQAPCNASFDYTDPKRVQKLKDLMKKPSEDFLLMNIRMSWVRILSPSPDFTPPETAPADASDSIIRRLFPDKASAWRKRSEERLGFTLQAATGRRNGKYIDFLQSNFYYPKAC